MEEPDFESPPTSHPPLAPAHRPPRGELTWSAIVVSLIVAAIMGASYPYMVMKLGFGPNVSVVAAFFGFIFLNLIARKSYDRWQNNIVQTAGTSAAQTAFMCVLLGAFEMLRADPTTGFVLHLDTLTTVLWLTAAGSLGVLMAVPLRRHFIVDEKLPFADGVAVAETLTVLDPPRGDGALGDSLVKAKQAARMMMIGVGASALVMLIREDGMMFKSLRGEWMPAAVIGTVVMAKMAVGWSYSLLSVGSGMLLGLRINVSMMLGATLAWIIAPICLVHFGVLPSNPGRLDVLSWVMWPATGLLVVGGLTALGMRWRLLIGTFRSLRSAKIDGGDFPTSWLAIGIVATIVVLCVVQHQSLHMPVWMTLAAIGLSVPLMLVGLRVLGETNWGPISALSNMMQGLFATIAPGNIAANMVASGTTGTIATSSEAIMQDFKAGDIIGSTPRAMTIAQLLAVPIGALAVALVYPSLVSTYGLIDQPDKIVLANGAVANEPAPTPDAVHAAPAPITADNLPPGATVVPGHKAGLSSPISAKWARFAQLLQHGVSSLPTSALIALGIFSVLGIVLTVLEANPAMKKYVPSPTGVGIGILVPFIVVATMFVGGVIGTWWRKKHPASAAQYLVPLSSGFIAGEAIVAVIVPLLLWIGLGG